MGRLRDPETLAVIGRFEDDGNGLVFPSFAAWHGEVSFGASRVEKKDCQEWLENP